MSQISHIPRRIAVAAAMLLAALCVAALPAGAATNDRPSAGTFVGEHSFNGSITLKFERRRGIGLHLGRYAVKGTLRCDDEEFDIDYGGPVTAKTAAKVKKDRKFVFNRVGMRLDGRFFSSRRVVGDITLSTPYCTQTGGFSANLR